MNKNDKEALICAYMKNGGQSFFIRNMDSYRDGGTLVFETTQPNVNFYVHHQDTTLHTGYPPMGHNKITNKEIIAYFKHNLDRYKENLERNINKLNQIDKYLSNM